MTGEIGVGNVSAAIPVAAADPVAARADAPLLPAPSAAPGLSRPAPGVRTEISTAARLLTALLNHPALADIEAPPAGPLLTSADPQPQAIAEALRSGIARSGLFYESHQAEWIAGTRDLDDLRREPQARPEAAPESKDAGLAALVRQQLDLLDGQPLQWRGELWPGMPLQIGIERLHDAREGGEAPASAADTAEDSWQGRIVSTLPALGQVTARWRVTGDRIHLELASTQPGVPALIAAEATALGRALLSSGLTLASFSSHADERA